MKRGSRPAISVHQSADLIADLPPTRLVPEENMATALQEIDKPDVEQNRSLKRGLGVAAVTVAGATAAWLVFRRWHTHWGATPEETAGSLPGDELIPGAG